MPDQEQRGSRNRASVYFPRTDTLRVVLSRAISIGPEERLTDNLYAHRGKSRAITEIRITGAAQLLKGVAEFAETPKKIPLRHSSTEDELRRARTSALRSGARARGDLELVRQYHPEALRNSRRQYREDMAAIQAALPDGANSDWESHFDQISDELPLKKVGFLFERWIGRLPKRDLAMVLDRIMEVASQRKSLMEKEEVRAISELTSAQPQPPTL